MNASGIRLLLHLPEFPDEPENEPARFLFTVGELCATLGFEVHAIATSAAAFGRRFDMQTWCREFAISPSVSRGSGPSRATAEFEFVHRAVRYRVLESQPDDGIGDHCFRKFESVFEDELAGFKPDLVLTCDLDHRLLERYARARRQGARVVLCLLNTMHIRRLNYLLFEMDAVVTPSRFLTVSYRTYLELTTVDLPTPIAPFDTVAERRDPLFFTMFNPSPKRGLPFFAQLAEQLGVRRPDIPLLVVESSKSAGSLARFGLAGGFDLRRHESIRVSPTGWRRSHIYGATRVLLAPYLFGLEGLGASVAEALANGIPPIASNRGALPEICNGGGCCLPIPSAITAVFPVPVEPSAVEPWVELISRLADDPSFYRAESERAAAAGARYRPDLVARQYGDFLSCVLTSPPSVKGDLA